MQRVVAYIQKNGIALGLLAAFILVGGVSKLGQPWVTVLIALGGAALLVGGVLVATNYHRIAERVRAVGIVEERRSGRWVSIVGPALRSLLAQRLWGSAIAGFGVIGVSVPLYTIAQPVAYGLLYIGVGTVAFSIIGASITEGVYRRRHPDSVRMR